MITYLWMPPLIYLFSSFVFYCRELPGSLEVFNITLWRWKCQSDEEDDEVPPVTLGSSPPSTKHPRYFLSLFTSSCPPPSFHLSFSLYFSSPPVPFSLLLFLSPPAFMVQRRRRAASLPMLASDPSFLPFRNSYLHK